MTERFCPGGGQLPVPIGVICRSSAGEVEAFYVFYELLSSKHRAMMDEVTYRELASTRKSQFREPFKFLNRDKMEYVELHPNSLDYWSSRQVEAGGGSFQYDAPQEFEFDGSLKAATENLFYHTVKKDYDRGANRGTAELQAVAP